VADARPPVPGRPSAPGSSGRNPEPGSAGRLSAAGSAGRLPAVGSGPRLPAAGSASRLPAAGSSARQAAFPGDDSLRAVFNTPAGKVFAFNTLWLCPFCGRVGTRIQQEEGWSEAALQHLRDECPAIQAGHRAPRFTVDQLRQGAHEQAVRHHLTVSPAWKYRDNAKQWYCPYCVTSGVKLAGDRQFMPEDVKAIAGHIKGCIYYNNGRGVPKHQEELREAVIKANATSLSSHGFQDKLSKDPVWRVRDRNGCWMCPYCRKAVGTVNFWPSRPELAIEDVAQHLLHACDAYSQKKPPVRDASELMRSDIQPRLRVRTVQDDRKTIEVDAAVYEMLVQLAKESVASQSASLQHQATMVAAQKRQMRMLPKPPVLPGFEIEVLYQASAGLSGDFYDFIKLDENRTGILIGDVSGHGVDAAVVMGMVKKVLNMAGTAKSHPHDVLNYANEVIRPDIDRTTFVTACYGILDAQDRSFTFARAGHNPVLLYNPHRDEKPVALRPDGVALGVPAALRKGRGYEEMAFQLIKDDFLILYTDGVAEQRNKAGQMLRIDGILQIVCQYGLRDAHFMAEGIKAFFDKYREGLPQEDDVTVIILRVQ
jgi:serine phosphatase RsbU (regulator of sigma subunit)